MIKTAILPAPPAGALAASQLLQTSMAARVALRNAPLPFDEFMHAALYTPNLGYYSGGAQKFGTGGDFTTAPEMTPLFAGALAAQVAQVLKSEGLSSVLEFGAGSGKLAAQLLRSLAQDHGLTPSYQILDVSAELRERQRATVQALTPECAAQLSWLEALPTAFEGVVLANEVLDAMPVKLLQKANGQWAELCVTAADGALAWAQQPTSACPPVDWAAALPDGYLTEIAPQAEAFMRTMAVWLKRGVALFVDYGFPESEYYHPQRSTGSLMCHYQHTAHPNPLLWPGLQDITAHVNFTGVALAAQDAGLAVLGYTSQARFLLNCGILDLLEKVQNEEIKYTLTPNFGSFKETSAVQKLLAEHEMGELFKVLAVGVGLLDASPQLLGFTVGDRSHTL